MKWRSLGLTTDEGTSGKKKDDSSAEKGVPTKNGDAEKSKKSGRQSSAANGEGSDSDSGEFIYYFASYISLSIAYN